MVDAPTPTITQSDMGNVADNTDSPGGIDIAGIMQAVGNFTNSLSASASDLTRQVGLAGQAQKEVTQGAQDIASGQVDVNIANERAAIKLRQDNEAARAFFGADPANASSTLAQMTQLMTAGEKDIVQRQQMIQAKRDQSFLDDPLQWITDQITLPFDIAAANTKINALNQHADVIQKLQAQTTQAETINAAIDTGASAERLAGLNKQALGKAVLEEAQSRMQLAQLGIQAVNVRTAINRDQLNATFQANDMIAKNLQLGIQATQAKNYGEYVGIMKTYRDEQALEAQNNLQARQEYQKKIDQFTTMFGLPKMTYEELQRLPAQQKSLYETMINDPNLQYGLIPGYNVADRLIKLDATGFKLTPGLTILQNRLNEVKARAQQANAGIWNTMKPDEKLMVIQKEYEQEVQTAKNNIKPEGGLFSPPPLSSVAKIPVISQMPLVKDMAPLAQNPQYPTKADDFITNALKRITDKKSTPAMEADQIAAIYKAINADNLHTFQYNKMGFTYWPTSSFATTVHLPHMYGGFGGTQTVDMANPAVVEGILTRLAISNKIAAQPLSVTTSGGGM